MHLRDVEFKNFQCYRGEQGISLQARPYAVVAKHASDTGASNGLGKTSFAEGIYFGLYGKHHHRLADGWITDGETAGQVRLTLDDGLILLRSKQRGKPVRLYVWPPGVEASKPALDAEGQRILNERLGISREDFLVSSYFEQGAMARLIVAEPKELMTIIGGWLDLEKPRKAEEVARRKLAVIADEMERETKAAKSLTEERDRLLDRIQDGEVHGTLEDALERMKERGALRKTEVESAKKEFEDAKKRVIEAQTVVDLVEDVERRADIVRRGKEARDARNALKLPSDAKIKETRAKLLSFTEQRETAKAEARPLRSVAAGAFDGKCPIAPIDCPAQKLINTQRGAVSKRLKEYEAVIEHATDEAAVLQAKIAKYESTMKAASDLDAKIATLLGRARELKHAKTEEAPTREEAEGALRSAKALEARVEGKYMEASSELASLATRYKRVKEIAKELEERSEKMKALEELLTTRREAMVIFGRNGAQRRISESTIALFQDRANEQLAKAGIRLALSVNWSREGDGLAKACDGCGNPFPASEKVKVCPRCATERGPHIVNKLEIELSRKSGGLKDLAGIYLQLAAASWLRERRGCAWATAILDEPMGALDQSNRLALGRQIVSTLGTLHFEQAILIAHSPDVLGALPARIVVHSDGDFAKLEVIE